MGTSSQRPWFYDSSVFSGLRDLSRQEAGDEGQKKYSLNKTFKVSNPMRFSSPVVLIFSLIFRLWAQHQLGLTQWAQPLGVGFLMN